MVIRRKGSWKARRGEQGKRNWGFSDCRLLEDKGNIIEEKQIMEIER
jgi:hypothetical protein